MSKLQTLFAASTTIVFSLTANVAVAAVNLSCDTYTDNDELLWARYIDTGDRQTFDVTVKLNNGKSGVASKGRPVFVGTENIGSIIASAKGRPTAKGGLSLSTYAGYANPAALPPNWPGAGIGTQIRVGKLSCELKG